MPPSPEREKYTQNILESKLWDPEKYIIQLPSMNLNQECTFIAISYANGNLDTFNTYSDFWPAAWFDLVCPFTRHNMNVTGTCLLGRFIYV